MKIKLHEIIPDKDIPFDKCKLGREPYAKILTDIVRTYADGFVLAINNEWGTGKTTFVKMWQQQLINEGFETVYFNAWENDFDNNPLVAIISELEPLSKERDEKLFKSVLKNGAVLIKNIAPALIKSLVKKYAGDIDEISLDLIKNSTEASTKILQDEIKEYTSKKKTITEFRKDLENFVKSNGTGKPLIFIVDELDRCRPSYSVEVLEQIKHLFSVPGIVFVLSIDKNHLASAVRGFYGSENINTDEYLRRFIDLEYSIPKPSINDYLNFLYEQFEFGKIFSHLNAQSNKDTLLKTAELLFIKSNATLRQQEKLFAQTRVVLQTFSPNYIILPHILFVLIFIKTMEHELFRKIEDGRLTLQELCDEIDELVPLNIEDYSGINFIDLEAQLLYLYNKQGTNHYDIQRDNDVNSDGKLNPLIKSKIQTKSDQNLLKDYFDDLNTNLIFKRRMDLSYLLTKINLMEPFQLL